MSNPKTRIFLQKDPTNHYWLRNTDILTYSTHIGHLIYMDTKTVMDYVSNKYMSIDEKFHILNIFRTCIIFSINELKKLFIDKEYYKETNVKLYKKYNTHVDFSLPLHHNIKKRLSYLIQFKKVNELTNASLSELAFKLINIYNMVFEKRITNLDDF
jgi:hypothetical protein